MMDIQAISTVSWRDWIVLTIKYAVLCESEQRRTVENYSTPLVREQSVTSTVAPVGAGKEIEYFFASDARFVYYYTIQMQLVS